MLDFLRIMIDARIAKLDERGASAVEYALLITGIAAIIALTVYAFGGVLSSVYTATCNSVSSRASAGAC